MELKYSWIFKFIHVPGISGKRGILTTNLISFATIHCWTDTNNFSFGLNQPHQKKWKKSSRYFQLQRFDSCQFTYWRPAHYLNDPFSITKQLCHWQLRHHTSDLASPAVKFDWSLVISWECRQGQFRLNLLGSLACWHLFKIYSNMISKDSRFFWSERWRVSIL